MDSERKVDLLMDALVLKWEHGVSDMEMLTEALPGWSVNDIACLLSRAIEALAHYYPTGIGAMCEEHTRQILAAVTFGITVGAVERERSMMGVS